MDKVNITEKFKLIRDHWNPRIVGELNDQHVRLVKIVGDNFEFHSHDNEDEMFFVVKGEIELQFEDKSEILTENEFLIVPKGTIHRPIAKKEAHLLMFVTNSNINTGDIVNNFTLDTKKLNKI